MQVPRDEKLGGLVNVQAYSLWEQVRETNTPEPWL